MNEQPIKTIRVNLFIANKVRQNKGFVAAVEIPPFATLPDTIVWGQRNFKLVPPCKVCGEHVDGIPAYEECFLYAIPNAFPNINPDEA
jgi:hypothetical protein